MEKAIIEQGLTMHEKTFNELPPFVARSVAHSIIIECADDERATDVLQPFVNGDITAGEAMYLINE